MEQRRTVERERELILEFDEIEDQITWVTEQLAGAEAMRACLERMTDAHARALRSYREHIAHVGAGSGRKVREYRNAARAAMEKAKGAVPAWSYRCQTYWRTSPRIRTPSTSSSSTRLARSVLSISSCFGWRRGSLS